MANKFNSEEMIEVIIEKLQNGFKKIHEEKESYWKAFEERVKELETKPVFLPNIQVINTEDNSSSYSVPPEGLVGFDKHYGRAITFFEFIKEGESSRHYHWTRFDIVNDNKISIELMLPFDEEKANVILASLYEGDLIKISIGGLEQYLNTLSINPWKVCYKRISIARDDFTTLQIELEQV